MQRDLCVYGDFFIWLKSLRCFILGYFFVWEITSKGSQWKEGNLMGTCQCNSLEDMVKTTRWSDQWGRKISFGICSHLLKSSGIGSVLRATHMVVGFIRRTFVLREEWTEEPQGRSESHLWLAWGIWHGDMDNSIWRRGREVGEMGDLNKGLLQCPIYSGFSLCSLNKGGKGKFLKKLWCCFGGRVWHLI